MVSTLAAELDFIYLFIYFLHNSTMCTLHVQANKIDNDHICMQSFFFSLIKKGGSLGVREK